MATSCLVARFAVTQCSDSFDLRPSAHLLQTCEQALPSATFDRSIRSSLLTASTHKETGLFSVRQARDMNGNANTHTHPQTPTSPARSKPFAILLQATGVLASPHRPQAMTPSSLTHPHPERKGVCE